MRLYDGGKILTGLAVFAGLMTFPGWYNAATGGGAHAPKPELPVKETKCVESRAYMKASHMELLARWRHAVVREGVRDYVSADGSHHDMSLSRTCLKCHANPRKFCTSCHDYAGEKPYCWSCHVEPGGAK
jgi:hypothetical protein